MFLYLSCSWSSLLDVRTYLIVIPWSSHSNGKSSFILLVLMEWSVLTSLTAVLHSKCFDLFLPTVIWVQLFIPIQFSYSSIYNSYPNQCFYQLGFCGMCVSFSSLFIQCMWMLKKPSWFSSIYLLLEHHHPLWNLSGRTAWLHHLQSGIVSICCLPGFISIVFLFGWVFILSSRQRQNQIQPQIIWVYYRDSVIQTCRKV